MGKLLLMKKNEIAAIPELLDVLLIEGLDVNMDANFC
jgi:predicted transposase YbfD/YdcC